MELKSSKVLALLRLCKMHLFKVLCGLGIFWLLFVGDYSVLSVWSLDSQENDLKKEIEEYRDSIANFEERINAVSVDSRQLERHARERMLMHKENEDLYLIDE